MTDTEPTSEERDAIADVIGLIERRFAWDRIDPQLQALFASRLADMLPGFDAATRWGAMPVAHRREWIWHATRTPAESRAVWDDDVAHLQAQCDDATLEAFREMTAQEGSR